jgi:sugar O-acyltransferase (sialic acid O-acetyltransferase NeuD family)
MAAERELIIVGASGLAKDLFHVLEQPTQPWRLKGLLDDAEALQGTSILGAPVLGPVADWVKHGDCAFVVALGSPRVRRKVVQDMRSAGEPEFATLAHASAQFSRHTEIGEGGLFLPVSTCSADAVLGSFTIANYHACIGHDARIGDYCTIAPYAGVMGNIVVEDGAEVGAMSIVRQGITIGRGAVVGMGAVVTKDVPPNTIVVGSPAKPLREIEPF